jgi:hypothetical protein
MVVYFTRTIELKMSVYIKHISYIIGRESFPGGEFTEEKTRFARNHLVFRHFRNSCGDENICT